MVRAQTLTMATQTVVVMTVLNTLEIQIGVAIMTLRTSNRTRCVVPAVVEITMLQGTKAKQETRAMQEKAAQGTKAV